MILGLDVDVEAVGEEVQKDVLLEKPLFAYTTVLPVVAVNTVVALPDPYGPVCLKSTIIFEVPSQ